MTRKKILFLCTGNSCRSQMAEGWAKHLLQDNYEAYSAGIETHGVNPHAVEVMAESGIDLSSHKSQLLEEFDVSAFDHIITVCDHAQESCPILPSSCRVIHRNFADPPRLAEKFSDKEDKLNCYRKVRDEIRDYIKKLPDLLK